MSSTVFTSLRKRVLPTSLSALKRSESQLLAHGSSLRIRFLENRHLNAVEAHSALNHGKGTLVLAHGFGSGLGFFYNNIVPLTEHYDRVIAFDWLGMGGSARPNCRQSPIRRALTLNACGTNMSPTQATDFFIDPLEEFINDIGLERFHLVGHSLGGYLTARYTAKYPTRVASLTLASPVGLVADDSRKASTARIRHVEKQDGNSIPFGLRLLDAAWAANITPQQLVRMMHLLGTDRGRNFVVRAVKGRFGNHMTDEKLAELVTEYLYHITIAKGSGEFAMNSVLKPVIRPGHMGVYAREPLEEALSPLQGLPVHVLFGDQDWLYSPQVPGVVDRLRDKGVKTQLSILPGAGHHLYMDNADAFHRACAASPALL